MWRGRGPGSEPPLIPGFSGVRGNAAVTPASPLDESLPRPESQAPAAGPVDTVPAQELGAQGQGPAFQGGGGGRASTLARGGSAVRMQRRLAKKQEGMDLRRRRSVSPGKPLTPPARGLSPEPENTAPPGSAAGEPPLSARNSGPVAVKSKGYYDFRTAEPDPTLASRSIDLSPPKVRKGS